MIKTDFIWNVLFLGLKQKRLLPQSLIFFVTARCNAHCRFCLYKTSIKNPTSKTNELTLSEIQQIAMNYGELYYLALSGGEPFLRDDIVEICECFIKNCSTKVIDIPSNLFFTKRILSAVEKLVKNNPQTLMEVQLSIDACGEAHDRLRGVPGLYVQAKKTVKGLQQLRKKYKNLRLKVSTVYVLENKKSILEIAKKINNDFFIDRGFLVFPHKVISNSNNLSYAKASLHEYFCAEKKYSQCINVRRDLYSFSMQAVKSIQKRIMQRIVASKSKMSRYCAAGKNILVINEQGLVFPCEMLWREVGSLRVEQYDCKKILSRREYADFCETYLSKGNCNCTWPCASAAHILTHPLYLLEIALRVLVLFLFKAKTK